MSLAYVFERFPAPTQTFCVREVTELLERGHSLPVFSIRRDPGADGVPLGAALAAKLTTLPREDALKAFYETEKQGNRLPQAAVLTIRFWGEKPDKERAYEAIWLGQHLVGQGISHVHCHFAGIAARTCWWLRKLYGIRFSFTAHANDVFCQEDCVVTLAHLMEGAEKVVTVSEFTAQWLRERHPAHAGKVCVVYNGLEMQPIADQTSGVAKVSPPLIASVGRLIEKKGFDDLITACGLLHQKGVAFQCEIIGGGPDEAALQQQIDTLGLQAHVRLLGAAGQPVVRDLLGRASLFALPCVTEKSGGMDNLPTVLMEAMAAKLPCVSTFLAGVPEMVADGVTGLLCGQRQPEAFAAHLQRLLGDPALCQRFGQAGWHRAEALFAKEKTIPNLLAVFGSVGAVRPTTVPYALSTRLRHLFQRRAPKAACIPVVDGTVRWQPEKEF